MKKAITAIACAIVLLVASPYSQAEEGRNDPSEVGIVSATDSSNRVLYIGGVAYMVADDVEMTSSIRKYSLDPMLIKDNTVVRFSWRMVDGVKTITTIHLLENMTEEPE